MIDSTQVKVMLQLGFTQREIAERLNCSTRQIRRIDKSMVIDYSVKFVTGRRQFRCLIKTGNESILWQFIYEINKSYSKTAWYFGVSRQAVYEKLNSNLEAIK